MKKQTTTQQSQKQPLSNNLQVDWSGDFHQAFGLCGLTTLGWWLGSLFAEQVCQAQHSWPFLELSGGQGAGKSSLLVFLWRCLGIESYEGFDPEKVSKAGRTRKLRQVNNLPVVLEGGSSRSSKDRNNLSENPFTFDELKTAFNGRIDGKPFRGAICFSQNVEIRGSKALLFRIVHCHCIKEYHTDSSLKALQRLQGMSTEKASAFLNKALHSEDKLLAAYQYNYRQLSALYHEYLPHTQKRIIDNYVKVASWAHCLGLVFNQQLHDHTLNALNKYVIARATLHEERISSLIVTF